MKDLRSRCVDAARDVLEAKTAKLPRSIPIGVDVGPIVDAILRELTEGHGVPRVPPYDHELFTRQRWSAATTATEAAEHGIGSLGVHVEDSPDALNEPVVVWRVEADGAEYGVRLSVAESLALAVNAMACVTAASEHEGQEDRPWAPQS